MLRHDHQPRRQRVRPHDPSEEGPSRPTEDRRGQEEGDLRAVSVYLSPGRGHSTSVRRNRADEGGTTSPSASSAAGGRVHPVLREEVQFMECRRNTRLGVAILIPSRKRRRQPRPDGIENATQAVRCAPERHSSARHETVRRRIRARFVWRAATAFGRGGLRAHHHPRCHTWRHALARG